jgi:hypothetical protein
MSQQVPAKPRRPRRPARRKAKKSKLPTSSIDRFKGTARSAEVAQLVREEIAKERQNLDIGDAGAQWFECVANPKADETGVFTNCRIPDGSNRQTILLRETYSYTFANGTNTSFRTQVCGQCVSSTTVDGGLVIAYGGDVSDSSVTPSTKVEVACTQATEIGTVFHASRSGRIVGGYLRIAAIADDDLRAKYVGSLNAHFLSNAATTCNTTSNYIAGVTKTSQTEYSAQDGITVRWSPEQTNLGFRSPNVYNYQSHGDYGASTLKNGFGAMPAILATGASNTNYEITASIVYEVVAASNTTAISTELPGYEPELSGIVNALSRMEFVTKANSFKSFLKNVWSGVKAGVSTVYRNRDAITKVIGMVSKIK